MEKPAHWPSEPDSHEEAGGSKLCPADILQDPGCGEGPSSMGSIRYMGTTTAERERALNKLVIG